MRIWLLINLCVLTHLFSHAQLGALEVDDPYQQGSTSILELHGYTHDEYDWKQRWWVRLDSMGVRYEQGRVAEVVRYLYYPAWKGYEPTIGWLYSHNGQGLLESVVSRTHEISGWRTEDSTHYTYTLDSLLTEEALFERSSNRWEPDSRIVMDYSEDGNDTARTRWIFSQNQWRPTSKKTKRYNSNGQVVESNELRYRNGEWDSLDQRIYLYYDSLFLKYTHYYRWNYNSPLVEGGSQVYTYDSLNRVHWIFHYYGGPSNPTHRSQFLYAGSSRTPVSQRTIGFDSRLGGWHLSRVDSLIQLGDSLHIREQYDPVNLEDGPETITTTRFLPTGEVDWQHQTYYNYWRNRYMDRYHFEFFYGDTVVIPKPPPPPIPEMPEAERIVYPNPTREAIHIALPDSVGDAQFQLYAVSGALVLSEEITAVFSTIHIEKEQLASGVYVYHLRQNNRSFIDKILIIQR